MSARDIIASWMSGYAGSEGRADNAIEDLTAAGWRLVGPDEVDPVTVERCAQLVEEHAAATSEMADAAYYSSASSAVLNCGRGIAAAIRAKLDEVQK